MHVGINLFATTPQQYNLDINFSESGLNREMLCFMATHEQNVILPS